MQGIETGGGRGAAPKRKVRRASSPRGVGPLAPKPSGVFAQPVAAQRVTAPPAPPRRVGRPAAPAPAAPAAALDVLPAKAGQNSRPYVAPPAKRVVRKIQAQHEAAQREARDTKSNADRATATAYLAAHPEILHPPAHKHGSLLATITAPVRLAGDVATHIHLPHIPNLLSPGQVANVTTGGARGTRGAAAADYVAAAGRNVPADTAELITTTPSSLVKLGDTAIHHPTQLPGLLAQPYKDLLADPAGAFKDHPVSTALMLDPVVRAPGRIAGKALRVTGKQTLERTPARLEGTALTEQRPASRAAGRNAIQKRRDRQNPNPQITPKQIQRRVDEHFDTARQRQQHLEARTVRAIRTRHAGLPKEQLDAILEDRVGRARDAATRLNAKSFAQEFGANARPSVGAAQRDAAKAARDAADARVAKATRKVRKTAKAKTTAMTNARMALAKTKTSPRLSALDRERRAAQTELHHARLAQDAAKVRAGVAKGRAEVLSRSVGGANSAGSYGRTLAAREVDGAGQRVAAARAAVRDADRAISQERARIAGVPPADADALLRASTADTAARQKLTAARADAQAARQAHIDTKQAMSQATLVDPASEGRVFKHKADARRVIKRLPHDPDGNPTFQIADVGKQYAVVPKVAAERLAKQRGVGTSPATMAKVMRRSRGALTQAVLPLSAKWLMGQGVEAGLRAAAAGAGPADLLRLNRVVKEMNAAKAGAGDELLMRVSGGQFGLTGTAREFAVGQRSLADEFDGTSLQRPAAALTKAGGVLPAKALRAAWSKYTNVVLDSVNAALENTARKAMAGQAIKTGLLDTRVIAISDAAIQDAARGLRGTDAQVRLAREVDRMYGQYQKFSPDKRSLLLHWTPFLPWYLNTAKFLFKVLPGDHPIKTALLADVDAATEQWRKDHGLSLRGGDTKPAWMLGGYPTKGGIVPVGRFTPFGVGTDVPGAVASLTLPQLLGPIKNAGGVDWKWQQLKMPGYRGAPFTPSQKALRALVTAVESQVPGVTQAGSLTGLERRYVDHKPSDQTTKQSLTKLINPLAPIPNTSKNAVPAVTTGQPAAGGPGGMSQAEIDQLVNSATSTARRGPAISQAEIDALVKAATGR